MKSKTLLALAVAGAFCTSAFAGGVHHSAEVKTPSSVSESAPWLAGKAHLAGWTAPESLTLSMSNELSGDQFVGASAGTSGHGSVGSEPMTRVETTEYWLIGAESEERGVGASSSMGGSGAVGFDSSIGGSDSQRYLFDSKSDAGASNHEIVVYTPSAEMILDAVGEESPLVSEHYLLVGPLSSAESSFIVLAIAPTSEDIALLDSLKEDFFVVTAG